MDNNEPLIMPVKPGTLSRSDKSKLTKLGITVFEHPEPGSIRLLKPSVNIEAGKILLSALMAIRQSNKVNTDVQNLFARALCENFIDENKK